VKEIRPHLVDEQTCSTDGWGTLHWKTLISGDRTPTCQITQGVAELLPAPCDPPPGVVADPLMVHHHAHAETYYVLAGEGVLWIAGAEFRLAPGVSAFIPGGAHHATWATGEEPLRILYTFAADSFGDVRYEFPGLSAAKQP
jgi:hypothetical protein